MYFFYLNWKANDAEYKVGEGQTCQENVCGRLHLPVAQNCHDDEQVSHHSKQNCQAVKKEKSLSFGRFF